MRFLLLTLTLASLSPGLSFADNGVERGFDPATDFASTLQPALKASISQDIAQYCNLQSADGVPLSAQIHADAVEPTVYGFTFRGAVTFVNPQGEAVDTMAVEGLATESVDLPLFAQIQTTRHNSRCNFQ